MTHQKLILRKVINSFKTNSNMEHESLTYHEIPHISKHRIAHVMQILNGIIVDLRPCIMQLKSQINFYQANKSTNKLAYKKTEQTNCCKDSIVLLSPRKLLSSK